MLVVVRACTEVAPGAVKSCFVSPKGVRCSKRSEILAEAQQQQAIDQANAAEAERLSKRKRLRKVDKVEADGQIDRIQALVAENAETEQPSQPSGSLVPKARKRLRRSQPEAANPSAAGRQGRVPVFSGTPSGLDISTLDESDREWLVNHPLYIKIHDKGYPIPIGDQDILALKAFTPKELGGSADIIFY